MQLVVIIVAVTVVLDAALIVAHFGDQWRDTGIGSVSVFADPIWRANADRSPAELFGYVKLGLSCLLLLIFWRKATTGVYAMWALVFGAILLDDLLLVHERVGAAVDSAGLGHVVAGLEPRDIGELSAWAAAALLLGVPLYLLHCKAGTTPRVHSLALFMATIFLALSAVGLDMVHAMLIGSTVDPSEVSYLSGVEAAGELLGTTVILTVSLMILLGGAATRTTTDRRW